MRIAIIGSGALASLFAARLHPYVDVVMLGRWPEQIAALQKEGLTIQELDGRETQHHFLVTDQPQTVEPIDIAIVLVKSYQTSIAAVRSAACLKPDGLVVTLQNGLGNQETLAAELGAERVAVGSTAQGAVVVRPGMIRHAGNGVTHLAAEAHSLALILKEAGLPTEIAADVHTVIWGKLIVNVGINPLTALLDQPNGFIADNPIAREIMCAAVEEAVAVARALEIKLPYDDPCAQVVRVAKITQTNISSMLQDVRRGNQTEIEAITGQIVALGRQLAISTPYNEALLQLVHTYKRPFTPLALETHLKLK